MALGQGKCQRGVEGDTLMDKGLRRLRRPHREAQKRWQAARKQTEDHAGWEPPNPHASPYAAHLTHLRGIVSAESAGFAPTFPVYRPVAWTYLSFI